MLRYARKEVSKTYNARRLWRLDRKSIRLDRRAGPLFIALAVFALDLFSSNQPSSFDTIA